MFTESKHLNPFCSRLELFSNFNHAEMDFLSTLRSRRERIKAGTEIISEGRAIEKVFILEDGWAYRYQILPNGKRQVLNFYLPGDVIGIRANWFRTAEYSVAILTHSTVSWFDPTITLELFFTFPRLAATLSWFAAQEESLLIQQVVGLGRRSAYERLAHFFVILLKRLQVIKEVKGRVCEIPVTQELLADTLGLTVVHINRTLKRLRQEGLIEVRPRRIVLKDIKRLEAISGYNDHLIFERSIPPETEFQMKVMRSQFEELKEA